MVLDESRCPCLSGETYGRCCAPLHRGERRASTAEALMRSRYSAFATLDDAYLRASWHPSTRPSSLSLDAGTRWLRLEILAVRGGGPFSQDGSVEFRAIARDEGGRFVLHEHSRFLRERGDWYYLDGVDAGSGEQAAQYPVFGRLRS